MPANDPLAGSTPIDGDPLGGSTPVDEPGSVFDKPTLGMKAKRIEKAIGPAIAGAVPPIMGAEEGAALGAISPIPGGAAIGAIAGAGLGGLAAPAVEHMAESSEQGTPYVAPSGKEELHSALWNAAFTAGGEGLGKLVQGVQAGDEAKAVLQEMPQAQRTVGKLRKVEGALGQIHEQDLRNRDFWKAHGLTDQQIDQVSASPDLEKELAGTIDSAQKTKDAFQAVVDSTRNTFKEQYGQLLGEHENVRVDGVPIGQQFQALAQGVSQHELTPSFRAFLQRKGLELTQAGEAQGPSVGGVPWKQLPEQMKASIREAAQKEGGGPPLPSSELSIQDLRGLRTELRENLPAAATNLDRQAAKQLTDLITGQETEHLAQNGASPVQLENLKALDHEYGRFQETIKTLDPRSEKFGSEVADAMFDPMAKNPGAAMNFINLAKKADAFNPSVMPQLRGAFLDKALQEARVPGQPLEELKSLRQLQDRWGSDKQLRTIMGEMFGKDSPLADPPTFAKVMGAMDDPAAIARQLSKDAGGGRGNMLSSPYIRSMAVYGLASGLIGNAATRGGLWAAISGQKGPEASALAIGSILVGAPLMRWVVSSGSGPAQRAMVNFFTNPTVPKAIDFAGELSGGLTSDLGPSPQPEGPTSTPPPDPRLTLPLPTLDAAWHKARDEKDDTQAKQIRDIVVRRMKAGEWKRLDPNARRQLAPFIREIGMPNG